MEITLQDQFKNNIDKAERVLIALPKLLSLDMQTTAEALRLFLIGRGKTVVVASDGLALEKLSFMQEDPKIVSTISAAGPLTVTLDTGRTKLDELRYEMVGQSVRIFLSSKQGVFQPEEVSVQPGSAENFDLIIVLGAASLEHLGTLFSEHTDLFYNTPKMAVAIDPGHEYFGAVNIVDVTVSSLAELVTQLLLESAQQLDAEVATALLAGIIAATASFQDVRTTPKTFAYAAQLVEFGARQQDIIIALFKTRDFNLLKLWGRLLARIKTINHTLLYSTLPADDFVKTATNETHVLPVFRELLDNISGYQSLVLLAESNAGSLELIVARLPHVPKEAIVEAFPDAQLTEELPHGAYRLERLLLSGTSIQDAEQVLQSVVTP